MKPDKETKFLWSISAGLVILISVIVCSIKEYPLEAQATGPTQLVTTRSIAAPGGGSLFSSDQVIFVTGTGSCLVTDNLALKGQMVTVIVKSTAASCVVTNTLGAIFTVPGIGTNSLPSGVQLGGWNTPSNEWTGVFDGVNW
jgi:hypothetical protein